MTTQKSSAVWTTGTTATDSSTPAEEASDGGKREPQPKTPPKSTGGPREYFVVGPRGKKKPMTMTQTSLELSFDMEFPKAEDHQAFIEELLYALEAYGAKPEALKKLIVTLREGSTIATIKGPEVAISAIVSDVYMDRVEVQGQSTHVLRDFAFRSAIEAQEEAEAEQHRTAASSKDETDKKKTERR